MTVGIDKLSPSQQALLRTWLPGAVVTRDHSWGQVGTFVLELSYEGSKYIAKAGDDSDLHLARELEAHRQWLEPWTAHQRAPELVQGDIDAKLLVSRYLEGDLVQGTDHEWRSEIYLQAGRLLAQLHGQAGHEDEHFEARAQAKSLAWLDRPHRIAPELVRQLREEIESWPTPSVLVVPTHGDWQPRNWLIHEGRVSVIDFGRAELRPSFTDFLRLDVQQFRTVPALQTDFLKGYGHDPREPEAWRRHRVREAVGTAVWSYQVGDVAFEQQGLRMITEALPDP